MEKRPFLLLEILLAISLVLLCIGPLVKGPFSLCKEGKKELIKLELERFADEKYLFVREHLSDHKWNEIGRAWTKTYPLLPVTIDLGEMGRFTYPVHYHLWHKIPKKTESSPLRTLWCKICFEEHPGKDKDNEKRFDYNFFVRKEQK